jgi:hypothetical protein
MISPQVGLLFFFKGVRGLCFGLSSYPVCKASGSHPNMRSRELSQTQEAEPKKARAPWPAVRQRKATVVKSMLELHRPGAPKRSLFEHLLVIVLCVIFWNARRRSFFSDWILAETSPPSYFFRCPA